MEAHRSSASSRAVGAVVKGARRGGARFAVHFQPGERVVFATYYRDQLEGQVSQYRIVRPDGVVWASWSAASTVPHYRGSYWWWGYVLGDDVPAGRWRFEVDFEGTTRVREFRVGQVVAAPSADSTTYSARLTGAHGPVGTRRLVLVE